MDSLATDALVDYLSSVLPTGAGARSATVIGIDGPDCSGKTTLANALVASDPTRWRALHLDDYVDPEVLRRDRETRSLEVFLTEFFPADQMSEKIETAIERSKYTGVGLVVEGMFLCRPQIRRLMNYVLRLEIAEALVLKRALSRDVDVLGSEEWVRLHYTEQCIPAQRIYRAVTQPQFIADATAVFSEEDHAWYLQ